MDAQTVVDQRTVEAAYSAYRATLRAARKRAAATAEDSRAGARKQAALKIASQRYRIPMGELKVLIRAIEKRHGISHEHPAAYQEWVDYWTAAAELEKQNTGHCPVCDDRRDRWILQPEDGPDEVKVRINPFVAEIEDELWPMLSCLGCYFVVESDI